MEVGDCRSDGFYGSFGRPQRDTYRQVDEFSDGDDDGSIFDVDFYDNLHSEFARELEADFSDGEAAYEARRSPTDEGPAPILDTEHHANSKEEMYAAYNELHNLAQGMFAFGRATFCSSPVHLTLHNFFPDQSTRNPLTLRQL